MSGTEQRWHREVISRATELALERLGKVSVLQDFYLAGGTGLALSLGHRRSEDLDFFHNELFDEEKVLVRAQQTEGLALLSKGQATLHVTIAGTKVSFLGYPYPVLFPFLEFQNVRVADPRDIACMKISAIAGRGTRRDFLDLYAASSQFGLRSLLELFQKKFPPCPAYPPAWKEDSITTPRSKVWRKCFASAWKKSANAAAAPEKEVVKGRASVALNGVKFFFKQSVHQVAKVLTAPLCDAF